MATSNQSFIHQDFSERTETEKEFFQIMTSSRYALFNSLENKKENINRNLTEEFQFKRVALLHHKQSLYYRQVEKLQHKLQQLYYSDELTLLHYESILKTLINQLKSDNHKGSDNGLSDEKGDSLFGSSDIESNKLKNMLEFSLLQEAYINFYNIKNKLLSNCQLLELEQEDYLVKVEICNIKATKTKFKFSILEERYEQEIKLLRLKLDEMTASLNTEEYIKDNLDESRVLQAQHQSLDAYIKYKMAAKMSIAQKPFDEKFRVLQRLNLSLTACNLMLNDPNPIRRRDNFLELNSVDKCEYDQHFDAHYKFMIAALAFVICLPLCLLFAVKYTLITGNPNSLHALVDVIKEVLDGMCVFTFGMSTALGFGICYTEWEDFKASKQFFKTAEEHKKLNLAVADNFTTVITTFSNKST